MKDKDVPQSRLGRLARFGLGGLATGAKMLVQRDGEAAAAAAAEMLGNLRGLAAKAGQIASYVDGIVPEQHRAAFETSLGVLRAAAPTSSPEQVRARLLDELGAAPEALFATFEDRPFASASIGQVHRATLSDGRAVAVKVQHTGIDKAMEADLQNAGMMEALVGNLGGRRLGSKQVIAEVKERFLEELDYALEAKRQTMFAGFFVGDPTIRIPRIVPERSSRRVMTSELHEGFDLDEAAKQSPELRRSYAETMWRFVFGGNLVHGMFNADPHPGNYLFRADGTITFLDFGCVQPLEPDHVAHARALHRAGIARDEAAFLTACRGLLGTQPGAYEDWALAFSRACFEPIFASPMRVSRAYVTSLVDQMRSMRKDLMFDKKSNFVPLPPGMLFMNRLQFGFYSVLARLDVEADYAKVESGLAF